MYHDCLPSLPTFCDRHSEEDLEGMYYEDMENPTLEEMAERYRNS